jgi:hypothetical protein
MEEDEDPKARKRRMANEIKKKWLAKQDPESLRRMREARAAAYRLRKSIETPEQRHARQTANADAYQRQRASETPEQRHARQTANADAYQRQRATETPEQRQARQIANAAAHQSQRASETLEQRHARQIANAAANQRQRASETPEQRHARQTTDSAAHQRQRATKTPEQRHARQTAVAAAYQVRIVTQTSQQAEERHAGRIQNRQLARRRQHEAILQEAINFSDDSVNRHHCGPFDVICQFCYSKNFAAERPADLKFTSCCRKGKVKLSKPFDVNGEELEYPEFLRALLSDPWHPNHAHFREHIRSYNSAVSFASMGAKIVDVPGRGPYVFKVSMVNQSIRSYLHKTFSQAIFIYISSVLKFSAL